MASIETSCPGCRTYLTFPESAAGASGPCYSCGATVTVPVTGPIDVTCAQCGLASQFGPEMLGQSGPCRGCGTTITVAPRPAAPVSAPPSAAPHQGGAPQGYPPQQPQRSGPIEVEPNPAQRNTASDIHKEASKVGMQVLGTKVMQIAQGVTTGENFGAALKAQFLFGGTIRTDRVLGAMIRSAEGDFFVVVPFSGNMMLAHEMASVLPGVLPSNLWLLRGALGAWSTGQWIGSEGGERDPLVKLADDDYKLNDGIEWDWESGRMKIKLRWGVQAVPATPTSTLHVVKTAQRGIVFKDFGLSWYLERRRLFAQFIQRYHAQGPPPRPSFNDPPLSTIFLDDIVPVA